MYKIAVLALFTRAEIEEETTTLRVILWVEGSTRTLRPLGPRAGIGTSIISGLRFPAFDFGLSFRFLLGLRLIAFTFAFALDSRCRRSTLRDAQCQSFEFRFLGCKIRVTFLLIQMVIHDLSKVLIVDVI